MYDEGSTTAERLEAVRLGATSSPALDLRSFWRELTAPHDGDDGYEISYEAARNYHDVGREPPREPPAAYLARVAHVFGVSLEWLVTGNGLMWPAARTLDEAQVAILEVAPGIGEMDASVRVALDELTRRSVLLFDDLTFSTAGDEVYMDAYKRTAGYWWGRVQGPIAWVGERMGRPVRPSPRQASAYAAAMLQAFSLALTLGLFEAADSLSRERGAAASDPEEARDDEA